jgi:hypothetical protein
LWWLRQVEKGRHRQGQAMETHANANYTIEASLLLSQFGLMMGLSTAKAQPIPES